MNPRRDAPPPRIPATSRSTISDRTLSTKRVSNGNNLAYAKNVNGIRTRNSNGNLLDADSDENSTFMDNYQPKIIDNKTRTSISNHRSTTSNHNNIQTSASTSSVHSTLSRTKVSTPMLANFETKGVNTSATDLNRLELIYLFHSLLEMRVIRGEINLHKTPLVMLLSSLHYHCKFVTEAIKTKNINDKRLLTLYF